MLREVGDEGRVLDRADAMPDTLGPESLQRAPYTGRSNGLSRVWRAVQPRRPCSVKPRRDALKGGADLYPAESERYHPIVLALDGDGGSGRRPARLLSTGSIRPARCRCAMA